MLLLATTPSHGAEAVYGPEPAPLVVHEHEATLWGRALHAERHFRVARWLWRGELVVCGLMPLVLPRAALGTGAARLSTTAPAACSLGLGALATNQTLLAADLAYQERQAVRQFALRSALLRTAATTLLMATWSDFMAFGRTLDNRAEQRRRGLLITSLSVTLVSIPLQRAAWRTVHTSIAEKLPERAPRRETPPPASEPLPE